MNVQTVLSPERNDWAGQTTLDWSLENLFKLCDKEEGNWVIGWSWGDDSTMLLKILVDKYGPDIPVLHNRTRLEFKQSVEYGKQVIDLLHLTNYHEALSPPGAFVALTRRLGLHGIINNKMACCSTLKNDPMGKWMHQRGFSITISGLRASESQRNCHYVPEPQFNERRRIWYANPLYYLEDRDVEVWYESTGFPKNPLYLNPFNMQRTGCAVCPMPLKRRRYSTEYLTYCDLLQQKFPTWYRFAHRCQRNYFVKRNLDPKGYNERLYRHNWYEPLVGALEC